MGKWKPSKEDVKLVCESVVSSFVEEDGYSCDYCRHCGERYGNWWKFFGKDGLKEPHSHDCPVPVARDILTGI